MFNLCVRYAKGQLGSNRVGPTTAASPDEQSDGTQAQQRDGSRLGNLGDTKSEVVPLVRRVDVVAEAGLHRVEVEGERPAPQAAKRTVDDRLVPLKHVAALVECAVRTLAVLELSDHRNKITRVDG